MYRSIVMGFLSTSFVGCASTAISSIETQPSTSDTTHDSTSSATTNQTQAMSASVVSTPASTSTSNAGASSSQSTFAGHSSTFPASEASSEGSTGGTFVEDSQTVGETYDLATATSAASSDPTGEAPDPSYATSAELLAACDLGWNLGNSLDVPEGETGWGNPVVNAELLHAVADAGFDIVRIPVTWSLFTGPGPAFTLDPSRLNRVQEVVEYALGAGLRAIINLHHDGADEYDGVEWLTLNEESGAISETNNAAVEARFRAVWTQLAEHFKAFDERLLFESMNEIHDGYDAPNPAYYPIINHLNQTFVDIVRGSGGANSSRHLVVPGYNTNIDYTLEGFEAPTDPTPNHLILSVHFYDPWPFAGKGASGAWGAGEPGADSWGQEEHVVAQFDRLESTFVDKGLPMIIGEYGAVNSEGKENYRRYYMEYVTQAACQRGLVPIYWDNGGLGSGPDKFGLFDRSSLSLEHPDILEAMFRGCTSTEPLAAVPRP